jgi:hypothetical protein
MDAQIAQRLTEYRSQMAESVESKASRLAEIGLAKYIEQKK